MEFRKNEEQVYQSRFLRPSLLHLGPSLGLITVGTDHTRTPQQELLLSLSFSGGRLKMNMHWTQVLAETESPYWSFLRPQKCTKAADVMVSGNPSWGTDQGPPGGIKASNTAFAAICTSHTSDKALTNWNLSCPSQDPLRFVSKWYWDTSSTKSSDSVSAAVSHRIRISHSPLSYFCNHVSLILILILSQLLFLFQSLQLVRSLATEPVPALDPNVELSPASLPRHFLKYPLLSCPHPKRHPEWHLLSVHLSGAPGATCPVLSASLPSV